ncbi:hypothetical protein EU537_07420 [Candidatus Thorarchaeota archaeon]|nr:MAG: hypothetical protein EU537_07420 [Candidatus Thorarchaeota archaeon]
MKKRLFIACFLAALLIQPILVGSSMPHNYNPTESVKALAQERGCRLKPSELSAHVPIQIDGISDFVSQGWPGSGTENDPYLIEGLNITAAIGKDCISITNTDSYFIIRDSYLKQGSINMGIYLENTSHASIEYVTIESVHSGIRCRNANNTLVVGSYVIGDGGYAQSVEYSQGCHIEDNYLFGGAYTGLNCLLSPDLMIIDNFCNTTGSIHVVQINTCNDTIVYGGTIQNGDYGIYSVDSYSLSIEGTKFFDNNYALYMIDSSNQTVNGILIDGSYDYGALFAACDDSSLTNSVVRNLADKGLSVSNCQNFTLSGNVIEDVTSYGAGIGSCQNLVFAGNSFDNIGSMASEIINCPNAVVESNIVTNTVQNGLMIELSPNSTVGLNTLEDIGQHAIVLGYEQNVSVFGNEIARVNDYGVYLEDCQNTSLFGNRISEVDQTAIYGFSGNNVTIVNNDLIDCFGGGIRLDTFPDSWVQGNSLSGDQTSNGIWLEDSPRGHIQDNLLSSFWVGIYINTCDNTTIQSNEVIDAAFGGITSLFSNNAIIADNDIQHAENGGIKLGASLNATLQQNDMEGCGVYFLLDGTYAAYNHTLIGNTVNGKDIYYGVDESSMALQVDDYGQIILLNCSQFSIADGTFEKSTSGIQMLYCNDSQISNVSIRGNFRAIDIYRTGFVEMTSLQVEGKRGQDAICIQESNNINLSYSSVRKASGADADGIQIEESDLVTIEYCHFDHNFDSIDAFVTLNLTIRGNQIINSERYGINILDYDFPDSQWVFIEDNIILNSSLGIYNFHVEDAYITNNTIRHCTSNGIYLNGAPITSGNVSLNIIEDCMDGIDVLNAQNALIFNNTLRWNREYGVKIRGTVSTEVYYNTFALNHISNGYDDRFGNFWDDGVSTGNSWHDYYGTPPDPYEVDDNTDDRYPTQYLPTEPIINQVMDVYYAEGSEGNVIVWYPLDDSLKNWEVTIDASLWETGAWNYQNITTNIDGLDYGVHTLKITVWDTDLNNVTDTVSIHVYDDTPPQISNVPNSRAFVDGSGQTLTWDVYDLHPNTYSVQIDEEEWAIGFWASGELTINIDGLNEGNHLLIVRIFDIDGNSAADTVQLKVIDDDAPPVLDSPSDIVYTQGSIGNTIVWDAEDDYPGSFEIIYNDSVYSKDDWDGSRIVLNVDGLDVGSHEFSLTVIDGSGNAATDSVTVTVLPAGGPTTGFGDFGAILMMLIIALGVVAVVVVVIYLMKKRR